MKKYYVKQIVSISPCEYDRKYGIFMSEPKDPEKIHCKEDDPNLIVWTYDKLIADKIAELLDIDDYMHENN